MKLLPIPLLLASTIAWAENDVPDTRDWYQVEVLVFSLRGFDPDAESEQLDRRSDPFTYPVDMLAPASTEALQPLTPGQRASIERYEALVPPDPTAGTQPEPRSKFLFESRSQRNNRPVPVPATEPTGADDLAPGSEELATRLNYLFSEPIEPAPFRSVASDNRKLAAVARSIRRSSRYDTLYYEAWQQPIRAAAKAQPILVQAGERVADDYELDGYLSLRRERFLHVDAALQFTGFTTGFGSTMRPGAMATAETGPSVLPAWSVRLGETRRMRSGELHYLDHPAFGVLIRIDPVTLDEP